MATLVWAKLVLPLPSVERHADGVARRRVVVLEHVVVRGRKGIGTRPAASSTVGVVPSPQLIEAVTAALGLASRERAADDHRIIGAAGGVGRGRRDAHQIARQVNARLIEIDGSGARCAEPAPAAPTTRAALSKPTAVPKRSPVLGVGSCSAAIGWPKCRAARIERRRGRRPRRRRCQIGPGRADQGRVLAAGHRGAEVAAAASPG